MKILISNTELTATQCYAYEFANAKRELRITIPQSEIAYSDLKTILKENTGEIVLTKGDGTIQTFVGYATTYEITDKTEDDVDVFYVVIQCVAEAERRALEAQQKATVLEMVVAEQSAVIMAQSEQVSMLEETAIIQVETIENILLDVIPATIEEAIANALAAKDPITAEDETAVEE